MQRSHSQRRRSGRSLLLAALVLSLSGFATPATAEDLLPAETEIPTAIDQYIDAALQEANSVAAPRAADHVVLRRTTLDLVGRIPTVVESDVYLQATDEDKHRQLVDRLLADPGYARHQAKVFDAMLMHGSGGDLKSYLTESFQKNRPWNELFRELVLGAEDDAEQKGPIQYVLKRAKDIDQLTVKASVDFFGVNISCAKCHDHPEAPEWSQDHFYGMKSFFARTFENGGFVGEREYGEVTYKTSAGESRDAQLMFLTGQVIDEPESKPLDNEAKKAEKKLLDQLKKDKKAPPKPNYSRREQLVKSAFTPAGELYFSRSIVNHVWAQLIGRGLVTPIDQMHPENPASHPELLDWLARDMRQNGYDLQRLIRGIVLSETYARSSVWDSESPRPEGSLFAIGVVRPLTPWQYATSLRIASYAPERFVADKPEESVKQIEQLENAARGFAALIELPGQEFQVGVSEALLFSNNERFYKEHLTGGHTLVAALAKIEDDQQLVETMFRSTFGRSANDDERSAVIDYLSKRRDRKEDACRQLVWALLTSSEMRFNY